MNVSKTQLNCSQTISETPPPIVPQAAPKSLVINQIIVLQLVATKKLQLN